MDSMSSPKRFLSGDDNYETRLSFERKKQKSGRDANTTVVDVSIAEDDKSASIREKLQCKLLKKQSKSDQDNSDLEALDACRRKLLATVHDC